MAYTRPLGSDDASVLCACSICGIPYRYPSEMRYCSDKRFRCLRTCDDPHIPQDEDKKRGISARDPDEASPRFTVGVKPSWYP
jgi:hypothetical protein